MRSIKSLIIAMAVLTGLIVNAQSNITLDNQNDAAVEDNLVNTFTKYFGRTKKEKTIAAPTNYVNEEPIEKDFYETTIDNIISVGKTFLGIPYRWGGITELGFDCSGFIKYIFEWVGVHLPRTSREMANFGEYVSKDQLKRGDLIFFTGRNSRSGIVGHIGIVVGVNSSEINIMHSSSSRGVHIEDLNKSSYFSKRYITARRLSIDKNKVSRF